MSAGAIYDENLERWRSSGPGVWSRTNPLDAQARDQHYGPDPLHNFFPDGNDLLEPNDPSTAIDPLTSRSECLVRNAIDAIKAGPSPGAETLLCSCGHDFFGKGEYELALRCYLNALRVSRQRDAFTYGFAASALQRLGDLEQAGYFNVRAAECSRRKGHQSDLADWLERAALAWEACPRAQDHGRCAMLCVADGTIQDYDSTTCFRLAKNAYSGAGDYASASRAHILEQNTVIRWTRPRRRTLWRRLMRAVWLYGESPSRVVVFIATIVFVWATSYLFFGFNSGQDRINYDLVWQWQPDSIVDYSKALYLSAMTLFTVGYGDSTPAPGISQIMAGLEGFLGIISTAMLVVTLQRRYVGR